MCRYLGWEGKRRVVIGDLAGNVGGGGLDRCDDIPHVHGAAGEVDDASAAEWAARCADEVPRDILYVLHLAAAAETDVETLAAGRRQHR